MKNNCNKNISFYYYGQDHLILNIYKYLKNEIENNNYIFLYCDENIINILSKNLNKNERDMVEEIELDKIIINSLPISQKSLEERLSFKKSNEFVKKNGFWGGVIVLDATYLIDKIGQCNFKEYLKELSNICKDNNFNILTCYDFSDYINRGKIINEDVIKASYCYHDYRLYGNKVLSIENFDIHSKLA